MTQWQMRVVAATVAFIGAYAMGYFAGLRINLTNSIAPGIWLTQDRPVMVGEYVMVCPPDNDVVRLGHSRGYIPAGWCPGGYGPLMKRIAGDDGDKVAIRSDGMYVNGYRLPHSAPLDQDGAGRPLVAWSPSSFQLDVDQVLLYGDAAGQSFDARYFGPVQRSQVLSVIVPIFVQTRREEPTMQEPDDPVPTRPALEEPRSPLRDALVPVPTPPSTPSNTDSLQPDSPPLITEDLRRMAAEGAAAFRARFEKIPKAQRDAMAAAVVERWDKADQLARLHLVPNPLAEYSATLPDATLVDRVVMQKFADAEDLDIAIPFAPDEAAAAGAFEEPALPDAEAERESR